METIFVRIVGKRQVRDGLGGHTDREIAIEGNPFEALLGRRNSRHERVDGDPGTIVLDKQRILKLLDVRAPVRDGDIAEIPPCLKNQWQAERLRLANLRAYETGIQCDLESGNVPSVADSNTE